MGTDQLVLSNELDKFELLLKSEKRKKLSDDDLELLTENKETIIWDLLDALTNRDKKSALKHFEGLFQNDKDFSYLSTMLSKQLKLLYWLKSGEISEESMKNDFKIHPYTISGLKRNIHKFDLNFIKLLFAKLTSLDFKVKQGKIEPRLGLVLLISSV